MKNLCLLLLPAIVISCTSLRTGTTSSGIKKESNSDLGQLAENDLEETYCLDLAEPDDIKDSALYNTSTLLSYGIKDACLCVKYQHSGCSRGEAVLVIDEKERQGPNRPEVMSHLLIKDAGLCEQLITDSACFSMKRMQLIGNEVLLHINTTGNNVVVKAQN